MSTLKARRPRGITLLEVLATMVILLVGIGATMVLVTRINQSNRRTLTAMQAQSIAERELENILAMGCTTDPPCGNLLAVEDRRYSLWQTAAGELRESAPPAGIQAREYHVAVDVDSILLAGSLENNSAGDPPVNRVLANGRPGNVANVRVSVSWREQEREGRQVVVLQTRMAP